MGSFVINEAMMNVPSEWMDQTINVLQPFADDPTTRILITRTPTQGDTLDDAWKREITEVSRRTAWFEALESGERALLGGSAKWVKAKYKDGAAELYQHRVMFTAGKRLLTFVGMGPLEGAAKIDAVLERALATLKVRAAES